jgi:hypothetical protein
MPRRFIQYHDAEVLKETEKALLVDIYDNEVWVPKSEVNWEETDVKVEGDKGTITISEWIATQKGLT